MWDVGSLFVNFPPQDWHRIQEESDLLWAAVQYFVMYVAIYLSHCVVFKPHVEKKGLFFLWSQHSAQCSQILSGFYSNCISTRCTMPTVIRVNSIYWFSSLFENFYFPWSNFSGKSTWTKYVSQWLHFLVWVLEESGPEFSSVLTMFGLFAPSLCPLLTSSPGLPIPSRASSTFSSPSHIAVPVSMLRYPDSWT